MTAIAERIGRVHLDGVLRDHQPQGRVVPAPSSTQRGSRRLRARPKPSKLVTNLPLRQAVEDGLAQRWSPEEISYRLIKDFPDNESMREP